MSLCPPMRVVVVKVEEQLRDTTPPRACRSALRRSSISRFLLQLCAYAQPAGSHHAHMCGIDDVVYDRLAHSKCIIEIDPGRDG